jgi:hypothetical protein
MPKVACWRTRLCALRGCGGVGVDVGGELVDRLVELLREFEGARVAAAKVDEEDGHADPRGVRGGELDEHGGPGERGAREEEDVVCRLDHMRAQLAQVLQIGGVEEEEGAACSEMQSVNLLSAGAGAAGLEIASSTLAGRTVDSLQHREVVGVGPQPLHEVHAPRARLLLRLQLLRLLAVEQRVLLVEELAAAVEGRGVSGAWGGMGAGAM